MATTESFSTMLKHYMPDQLLVEELAKRSWVWDNLDKDDSWMGGQYDVPFLSARASSVSYGALTASADINSEVPVLGYVSTQPELWGSMKFNEKDLDRHNGDMKASFLKILPDAIDRFVANMQRDISISILRGYKAKLTATGGAAGACVVDHPELFELNELVSLDDDDSSPVAGYVRSINRNTKTITLYDAASGGSAVNCSGYTVAQNAKIYSVGQQTAGFTSLKSSLLSLANGGSTNLHNVAKTAHPMLQATNISGSTITEANIVEKLIDAFYDVRELGAGEPRKMIMNYKNFRSIVKSLELNRQFSVSDRKSTIGFDSVTIGGVGAPVELVALREMDLSEIFILDPKSMVFAGNNFFNKKRHMNGEEFFLERATTGYTYIVDIKFFGDLIIKKPSYNGIIHSISY